MDKVQLALDNATETHGLLVGPGALSGVAAMFREQFPDCRAVVISDDIAWRLAGERVQHILEESGIDTDAPYIFHGRLSAEWTYVEALDQVLGDTDAIAVAVGSGTINDLAKLCSHHQGRPYMIVATAISMDGYVAYGASVTRDGVKNSFACPAPRAVVADVEVAATAPMFITASGYADLYAKVTAGADWILADAVGCEPIDPVSWHIVQQDLKESLADPEGCRKGDFNALRGLVEGLLLSGFAMQAYHRSSRPASGAEHQFSHMLNMFNFVMKSGFAPSHGFQVSLGTIISLSFYEQLLALDMKHLDVEACVEAWPSLQQQRAATLDMFHDFDFAGFVADEVEAKYVTPDELRAELTLLRNNWYEIRRRLRKQLIPLPETIRRLRLVGAPTHPDDIDLPMEQLRSIIIGSQQIRNRYTILDLALHLGKLDEFTDATLSMFQHMKR